MNKTLGVIASLFAFSTGSLLASCAVTEERTSSTQGMSFEEFEAKVIRSKTDGAYIVEGDHVIPNDRKLLRAYWEERVQGALLIDQIGQRGGPDNKWTNDMKKNLTYCVSNEFGARKADVLAGMMKSTEEGWERMGDVNFIYLFGEDGNCTDTNPNVVFNVRPVDGESYIAAAFFPNSPRNERHVFVDMTQAWNLPEGWTLQSVMAHELGHALGFRHEHIRDEAGDRSLDCMLEGWLSTNWRALTAYDKPSIMHYPQCNGTGNIFQFSQLDGVGVSSVYGAPNSNPPPAPTGRPKSTTINGRVAKGKEVHGQPVAVVPGTTFTVKLTGSGDPDLYVDFGQKPTRATYACRSIRSGATEECRLDVPAGKTTAYVMVYGTAAATFTATANWVAPN